MTRVNYRVIHDNFCRDYIVHHDTSLTYWGIPQEFIVSSGLNFKFNSKYYTWSDLPSTWSDLSSTWEGYLKSRRFEVVEFDTEQEVLDYLSDLAFTEELLK